MSYVFTSKHNKGFTLLELVLVLFILAILTTTSLSFIENEDSQLRYDASIRKRDLIIDVLYQENIEGNQKILSGYIVDNGMLPPISTSDDAEERLLNWLTNDKNDDSNDDLLAYGVVTAHADTNGTPVELTDGTNNYNFFKGFRNSAYLRADNEGRVAKQSELIFKDEWGQDLFISDISSNSLTIGYDGNGELDFDDDSNPDHTQMIKTSPFNLDNNIFFSEDEWTIDRDQLHIVFTTNDSSCGPPPNPTCDYTISISVFVNDSTCDTNPEDCWDTYYYTISGLSNGDSRDTLTDTEAWNHNGNGDANRVPAGDHLVVVLDSAGDATTLTSARFKVLPNSTQPTVTLTVP